ncbi:MAG TPA: ATP-dependent helicase [Candidatus Aenigmarchaeota archaeon]|nr:ATP-dependent helicase [Candidatus Aenigmarchaeota archaeon]
MKIVVKGIAGSGKTTLCREILLKKLEEGYSLEDTFYTSFTRSAIASARQKLIEAGFEDQEVRDNVRTMHSFCFRLLGLGRDELMRRKDYEDFFDWLFHKFGIRIEFDPRLVRERLEGEELISKEELEEEPDGNKLLAIYDLLRNKYLVDVDELTEHKFLNLDEVREINFSNPMLDKRTAFSVLKHLKVFKRDLGKFDFADLLFQVWKQKIKPEKKVYFFDEFQDFTRLQYEIYKLWTEDAEFIVVLGDELQCQYVFMGGSPEFLIKEFETADKQIVLSKSWRIPQNIIDYVWEFLSFNRARMITVSKPIGVDFEGEIIRFDYSTINDLVEYIKHLKDETIILTRTNWIKRRIKQRLVEEGFVFLEYGKGKRYWTPLLVTLFNALLRFKKFQQMTKEELYQFITHCYVGNHLHRGVQSKVKRGEIKLDKDLYGKMDLIRFFEPRVFGYTFEQLVDMLKVEGKEILKERYSRNPEFIEKPKLYISTIHSFKGLEMDNVIYVTNLTHKILSRFNKQEEIINSYVAMTRPKKRLILMSLVEFKPNILIFPRR